MSYLELLKLASPEIVIVITALVVLAIGLVTGHAKSSATISTAKPAHALSHASTATGICSVVAALGLAIAIGAILVLPQSTTLFGGMLVITPLTRLFKIICIALAFFTVLLITSQKPPRHPGEYLALILFATVGLMLLVGSEELLMIFIGLELLGLSLYVMTAFDKTDVRSAEAGLKYLLFGSTSSAFTLFGISLIYGMSGTTGFAPMHGSADWHAMTAGWSPVLAALAALSILIGNMVALAQSNVRRLLAYSAVAHGGYTLIGLVAGGRDGFSAALFYTTTYAITLVGAFGVVGFVRRETGGDNLANFSGLYSRSPLLAGCMAIFMLSLAGIPPLAGFFGKFYLFSAALRAGPDHGLLWLVALALFGSFISLYYYLIVLKFIFVDKSAEATLDRSSLMSPHGLAKVTICLLAVAVLLLGVMPDILAAQILAAIP